MGSEYHSQLADLLWKLMEATAKHRFSTADRVKLHKLLPALLRGVVLLQISLNRFLVEGKR